MRADTFGAARLAVCRYPTLVELAGLPTVPKCEGNPEPTVHCLMGTSYASAFGVGSEPPRTFITHQWPYSMYASPVVPHTDDPVRGAGTMAYGIRTDRYRCKIPLAFLCHPIACFRLLFVR